MKWKGDKWNKETITEDGYLLRIRFINKLNSYWWATFFEGEIIAVSNSKKDLKLTLSAAQKAAQQRMIKHLRTKMAS
ncbi:hypothetical protein ACJD0Z_02670 [Flavobacteriaceae bacterium M23B6Z8]